MTQINPLDRSRSSRHFINIDDCPADAHFTAGMIRLAMNWRGEAIDDVAFLHANHAAITAGHSQISYISRAFVQDALVGSLHVRVRAVYGRDSPVEMPTHRSFFGRGFGMHINDTNLDVIGE